MIKEWCEECGGVNERATYNEEEIKYDDPDFCYNCDGYGFIEREIKAEELSLEAKEFIKALEGLKE